MTSRFDMPYRTKEDEAAYQVRYRQSPDGKAKRRAYMLEYHARKRKTPDDVIPPGASGGLQHSMTTWGNTQ